MMRQSESNKCDHKDYRGNPTITILKSYRQNFPFGKKAKSRCYDPPKKCTKICTKCGAKLERWKPHA